MNRLEIGTTAGRSVIVQSMGLSPRNQGRELTTASCPLPVNNGNITMLFCFIRLGLNILEFVALLELARPVSLVVT